jgi:hypothetical protein
MTTMRKKRLRRWPLANEAKDWSRPMLTTKWSEMVELEHEEHDVVRPVRFKRFIQ